MGMSLLEKSEMRVEEHSEADDEEEPKKRVGDERCFCFDFKFVIMTAHGKNYTLEHEINLITVILWPSCDGLLRLPQDESNHSSRRFTTSSETSFEDTKEINQRERRRRRSDHEEALM
jgi:hypothetical protein